MHSGFRLKEERERLGLSQVDFAAIAGATRKTLFNWESAASLPNTDALAAWAAHGLDVLYVVTGQRNSAQPSLDAAEQVLLQSYRRCTPEARAHLIQTAALLSAGLAPPPASEPSHAAARKKSAATRPATTAPITLTSHGGDGTVQVGYARGKVSVKK